MNHEAQQAAAEAIQRMARLNYMVKIAEGVFYVSMILCAFSISKSLKNQNEQIITGVEE